MEKKEKQVRKKKNKKEESEMPLPKSMQEYPRCTVASFMLGTFGLMFSLILISYSPRTATGLTQVLRSGFYYFVGVFTALPLNILGMVFGALGFSKKHRAAAIIGFVMSLIGFVVYLIGCID
jgi:hypothetical protein